MEIYAFGLVILAGLIWLAVWLSKGNGYKEAENEGLQDTLEIIEANKKVVWRNEVTINKLSDDDVNKLLTDEWTRK